MSVTAIPPQFALRPAELVNLHGQNTGREHLSHSSLGTLLSCQEKYRLHYEEQLRPAITATPLQMGRGFAEALRAGDPQVALRTVMAGWNLERERAAQNVWLRVPSREEAEINGTIAFAAAAAYLARYGPTPGREMELRQRVRNPRVGGRASPTHDLVARVDAADLQNHVLIEDKLAGSLMRGQIARRARLDRQTSIGTYLLWRVTGIEEWTIHYRVTLKPSIRRRQNEGHEEFLTRIAHDYVARPEFYMHEETVTRGLEDFLRLERELWRWASVIRDSRLDGTWPRNTAACLDFNGCKYLALCAGDPGAMHEFVREPPTSFLVDDNTEGQVA